MHGVYATGSTREVTRKVDASDSVDAALQSTSACASSRLSTAAFPSSVGISISGLPQPLNSSERVDIDGGRELAVPFSLSSAVGPKLSPSASLTFYYHSPAEVVKSTSSMSDSRKTRLQRSLTEPAETCAAEEAVTLPQPEIASGTDVDASTAKAGDGLDLWRLSTTSGGGQIASGRIANQADDDWNELASLDRRRPQLITSGNGVGDAEARVVAEEVANEDVSNAACSRGPSNRPPSCSCPDSGRGAGSDALLAPSGELISDNTRFIPTRQGTPPESRVPRVSAVNDCAESPCLFDKRSHDLDPVQSRHPEPHRSDEDAREIVVNVRDVAALSDPFDTPTDKVFLREPLAPGTIDIAIEHRDAASVEQRMPGVVIGGPGGAPESEIVVGESANAAVSVEIDRERPANERVRQDSFNRPDSPMFHRLMDLPRDSVILRNRRRRRHRLRSRRDSSCSSASSTSSSSSSSVFLPNSRRSLASGASQLCYITLAPSSLLQVPTQSRMETFWLATGKNPYCWGSVVFGLDSSVLFGSNSLQAQKIWFQFGYIQVRRFDSLTALITARRYA